MLGTLSNQNLIQSLRTLVSQERRITREILEHINEVERRRLYADLGFPSAFEWLTKDLGYSEAAAMRRLSAARMIRSVPHAIEKLAAGEVNLTTLAQVQIAIRAEEKRTGEKMPLVQKSEILSKVESCSSRETEKQLAAIFPEISKPHNVVHVMNPNEVRAHVTFTTEQMEKISRAGELLSHKIVDGNLARIIEAAVDDYLARKDPLLRVVRSRKI